MRLVGLVNVEQRWSAMMLTKAGRENSPAKLASHTSANIASSASQCSSGTVAKSREEPEACREAAHLFLHRKSHRRHLASLVAHLGLPKLAQLKLHLRPLRALQAM